jgi:hypothetical protein
LEIFSFESIFSHVGERFICYTDIRLLNVEIVRAAAGTDITTPTLRPLPDGQLREKERKGTIRKPEEER